MKKVLSVFLAIFLLVSSAISLISCADTDQNQTASVTGTDSKANFGTNIPTDLNFSDESDNTVYFVKTFEVEVITKQGLGFHILAHNDVRSIAVNALYGIIIPHLLHLNICKGAVVQLYKCIHNDKGAFF